MKSQIHSLVSLLGMALVSSSLAAKPELDTLFGDFAMLQADATIPVRGTASPGEELTLRFADKELKGTADGEGHWCLTLPPLSAGVQGDLIVVGEDGEVVSRDVLVGDVWLLSGQSNIEWTLKKSDHADEDIEAADVPQIRHFKVNPKISSEPVEAVDGHWAVCTPQNAGEFSAIGYYMARDLLEATGRPQGLVNATKGGTLIKLWINDFGMQSSEVLRRIVQNYEKADAQFPEAEAQWKKALAQWEAEKVEAEKRNESFSKRQPKPPVGGPSARGKPGGHFNAMVHPILGIPYRGVVWYQGEANVANAKDYGLLMRGLIEGWRHEALQPNLPFVIFQLPNFGNCEGIGLPWSLIREGQAQAAANMENTSLVVSIDVAKDLKDIHPRNKEDFADRLSRVILRDFYGEPIVASGPSILGVERIDGGMRVQLDSMNDVVLKENPEQGAAFELAGEDLVFHPANAILEDGQIIVRSEMVPHPTELRYAFRISPISILYNEEGLPAAPFRTDNLTR